MPASSTEDRVTQGITRVRDCCTFEWFEAGGRRVVVVSRSAHPECFREFERAVRALGVTVVYESSVRGS